MAYSQKSISDKALRIATMAGLDPHTSPVVDNGVVAEDLFYDALRRAVAESAKNPSDAQAMKRDHTITMTDGVGTMPDTALDDFLSSSSIYSTTDSTVAENSSYCPRYVDYQRPVHSQLSYYAVQGSSLLYREPGGDAGAWDGDLHLVTVSTPTIPATITDPITISTELAELTVTILASMLKGG